MSFLITGANGFIGQVLCDELLRKGQSIRAAVRSVNVLLIGNIEAVIVGSIDGETDWIDALRGVDIVINLAGRVHIMDDSSSNPLSEYCIVNAAGTECLAKAAAGKCVRRFIFMITDKVNQDGYLEKYLNKYILLLTIVC